MGLLVPGLLLLAAVVWAFRGAAGSMVDIWLVSHTFMHGFLVPPIVAWLVWRQRASLGDISPSPAATALIPMAGACLLWLLGELAEVNAAMHFGLVAMVVLLVPALFGWALARALAFPLLFLFFAVPFGDFTVPYLQQWTADVTVAALRATGIPVYREGMQFIIPSGTWSVIEACSGVRYLIASVMVGTLFAYLNYSRTSKRIVFVLASIVVPIIANWIRAYTIVMIGHVTGSPKILGFEHTTYGWWLFGLIVALLFAAGARWADPEDESPPPGPTTVQAAPRRGVWPVALAILALLGLTQGIAARLDQADRGPAGALALPAGQGGWRADPDVPPLPWVPAYANPTSVVQGGFTNAGQRVTVWAAYYHQQDRNRRLVSITNQVVSSEDPHWGYQIDGSFESSPLERELRPMAGTVRRGAAPSLQEAERMRVWHLYWIDGRWTRSPARAKLWQALDRLQGRGGSGAALLLATPLSADADAVLAEFAATHRQALGRAMAAATGGH